MNKSLSILLSLALLALASCSSLPAKRGTPALGTTTWTSDDGKQMPWRVWKTPAGVREHTVIITVHGLSGAASDFWLLGERLPPKGITVYAYELRGQGNDPDEHHKGDIRSAEQWLRDLETFHQLVRQRHPKARIVWYGESLGSLIVMHAAAQLKAGCTPDAIVLASPVAGLRMHISELERCLLRSSSRIAPTAKVKLGSLAGVDENKIRVTSTSTHGVQMAKTPHHIAAFTLRLLREMDNLMRENPAAAKRLQMPLLVLGSPHDVVASPEQVRALFDQLAAKDKTLRTYDQSYHLLLHDVQHEEVLRDLLAWLRA